MKAYIAIFVLVASAVALNEMASNVQKEVHTIVQANPGITADECTMKCDDLFQMMDDMDEKHTDDMCRHYCECETTQTCGTHSHPDNGHHP